MNTIERKKLLDRVRKLYAMSQETDSSPHEAEIALRRCQSLMNKFGIVEADLETSEFSVTHAGKHYRATPKYVHVIASATALLHDCIAVADGQFEFCGYAVDTEVAKLTHEYLLSAMERYLSSEKKNIPAGAYQQETQRSAHH